MSDLPIDGQELIAKLRIEGLTFQAIRRITGFDVRTIRKYVDADVQLSAATLPHCRCKPGLYEIGCPVCDGNLLDGDEE